MASKIGTSLVIPVKRNIPKVRTLTRKHIEDKVEEKLAGKILSKKILVDTLFDSMRELLMTADPIVRMEIRDFGVFSVRKTKPKPKARNLKTGGTIYVPERRKLHFKPGLLLKRYLKEQVTSE